MSEPEIKVDGKLGHLLLRGWTMTEDSCGVPNCCCPIMRNPDGRRYCCGCECWINDKNEREKVKFNDLLANPRAQPKKPLQKPNPFVIENTNTKIDNAPNKQVNQPKVEANTELNDEVNIYKEKIKFLLDLLKNEKDVRQIKVIVKDIILIKEAIKLTQ